MANQKRQDIVSEILEENQETISSLPKDWRRRLLNRERATQRPNRRRAPSIKPKVHAASKDGWVLWMKNWEGWINLFVRASDRLRSGIKEALNEFPPGAFIPSGCYLAEERPPPLK